MLKSLLLSVLLSSSVGVSVSQLVCDAQPLQHNVSRSVDNGNSNRTTTLYTSQPMYQTETPIPNGNYPYTNTINELAFNENYIYHLEFSDDFYNDSLIFSDIGIGQLECYVINLSFNMYISEYSLSEVASMFESSYPNCYTLYFDFDANLMNLHYGSSDSADGFTIEYYPAELYNFSLDFVLLYGDFGLNADYCLFSACENIPMEYVPIPSTQSSNLYTILYNFYSGLFNGTELDSVTFNVGNSNMTMNSWISHTLTILTLVTFVVVLFFFLKWLFKVISGLILLKN